VFDAAFEKSFALDPERKKLALAAEHHKAGRHKEAEKLYRELLRENPNNVDAMRMLAGIAASRSFAEEAESLFRRAISLAPDFALAHLDLGMLLQEQHRYSEAIECFAKTAALQPKKLCV
jgi:tetratricopeptide (TPR) repeat protein